MVRQLIALRCLTAILTLAVFGLSGCQQTAVRVQRAAMPTDAGSGSLAAAQSNVPRPMAADEEVTPQVVAYRDSGWNRSGALMYASAAGPSVGRRLPVAAGQAGPSQEREGGTRLASRSFLTERSDLGVETAPAAGWRGDKDTPLLLAAGTTDAAKTEEKDKTASTAQCAAFEKDLDADLGEVLRAGCEPTLGQMSALMDNPLGNVAMLFTQVDLYRMENPVNGKTANKWNYMGIAQFPKAITEDWNLINRVVWNVPSMPLDQDKIDRAADAARRTIGSGQSGAVLPPSLAGAAPIDLFDGRTTSFGDMYYVGLFSPKKPTNLDGGGKFLWGAGFDVGIPTATEDILGTGKWSAGPSALAVYLGPKWKVGGLLQHYWDFAGDDDRDDVNMTNLQYFYYYSLDETTSIGAAPNIIANWEQDGANAFTVPIGIGINKTFQFGKVPVRFGAEFHYNVVQPHSVVGSEWDLRFYIIPAAPSALFEWMTKPLF